MPFPMQVMIVSQSHPDSLYFGYEGPFSAVVLQVTRNNASASLEHKHGFASVFTGRHAGRPRAAMLSVVPMVVEAAGTALAKSERRLLSMVCSPAVSSDTNAAAGGSSTTTPHHHHSEVKSRKCQMSPRLLTAQTATSSFSACYKKLSSWWGQTVPAA